MLMAHGWKAAEKIISKVNWKLEKYCKAWYILSFPPDRNKSCKLTQRTIRRRRSVIPNGDLLHRSEYVHIDISQGRDT